MSLPSIESQVETVLSILVEKGLLESASVVLIGSAARGSTHAASDIDVLVVLPTKVGSLPLPYEIDAHIFTRTEFLERLQRTDDLACWAIRCGKVLSDRSGWWSTVAGSTTYNTAWPDWRQKISHATRRLINSMRLAETRDTDAAWEECALAASHVARAILLRDGIFPLSRLELIEQLTDAGFPHLGSAINKLVLGSPNQRELSQFTSYVKKWVSSLSKDGSPGRRNRPVFPLNKRATKP